jgi:uncharacterized membrane protein YgdD (TMEM256/DUF423 family)
VVAGGGGRPGRAAGGLLFGGVVLFSGSLYALALTGARSQGAVTPVGGLALILGWLTLAVGARRAATSSTSSASRGP